MWRVADVTLGFAMRLRAALLAGRRANVRGYGAVARHRGDGFEFAELREYAAGDDPRRIDWAATARAGALQTRVMHEDVGLLLAAVVDSSSSMHVGRTKSNYDVGCDAARAWYEAAIDDDRCTRVGREVHSFAGVRGRAAAAACALLREAPGGSLEAALRLAVASLPRGARLLVISDFYELPSLGDQLRRCSARFDVTALLSRDPWFAGLPLAGFVRLRDAESGEARRFYIGRAARKRYARVVAERERIVMQALRDYGLRVASLDEALPVQRALGEAFGIA